MAKLTIYGFNLLKRLSKDGTAIIHSQDGDRAWLRGQGDHPTWGDLDWREMATLRNAGQHFAEKGGVHSRLKPQPSSGDHN